jgi:SNF family Na+-dependent transporter
VAHEGNSTIMEIENLGVHGPSLAFLVYPAVVAMMPLPNIFSILFFGAFLCILIYNK